MQLYRTRQHALVPRTKFILRRIIALTVETNILSGAQTSFTFLDIDREFNWIPATAAITTLILFICSHVRTSFDSTSQKN